MIKLEHTQWPICPHCGSYQVDDMEGYQYQEVECSECGKSFKRFRHIEITYTTEVTE